MTRPRGLSSEEAARRLAEQGPNEIEQAHQVSPWRILARQFIGAMTWLLLAATLVSAALGEYVDAGVIAGVIVLNAVIGFVQEYRAERAVEALQSLTAPLARVIREGHAIQIRAREVVRGDVLILDAGDLVAADGRLLDAHSLQTNEASLTGESLPVSKGLEPSGPDTPLAERSDRVFMGTAVTRGTGMAEVDATGMQTEFGRIAGLLDQAKVEPTPLQRQLDRVGRMLLVVAAVVVGLVAILGLVRGYPWADVLLAAISLAVAAVPEGLQVLVTVALAVGVRRMAAHNVLVRRLPAVETLGSVTTICTDKTGTLTTGTMIVRELWGPDPERLLDAAVACSDAELDESETQGSGDPTEVAILVAAAEQGIRRADIERQRPRVSVEPFDAETKRMIVRRADGWTYVKGASEVVLPMCEPDDRAAEATGELAARALRVLAVAAGPSDADRLELLGLIGLADPPRPEAMESVAAARRAGIRTIMITGDHPVTAHAIAREIGIVVGEDDPSELVHARATSQDKIHIVRALEQRGEIVAMTGDGVNDAPALREAHIGIAMGKTGTDVSREAAAMVLADDNFASIVQAVREGRGIFDNIRKTLVYLLSGNAAELMLVFAAAAIMLPPPLVPLQILWINLITDSLPGVALVMDRSEADVLERPPRPAGEPILGRPQWLRIGATGLLEASIALAVFAWFLDRDGLDHARSLAFSVVVFSELFRSFAARSPTKTFWQVGAATNLRLLMVVVLSVGVQFALHSIPFTQQIFAIGELTVRDALLSLGLGLVPVTIHELHKLFDQARARRRSKRPADMASLRS
jgi:Ca2+-transporting ATPase